MDTKFSLPLNWETKPTKQLLEWREEAIAHGNWWAVDDIDLELHKRGE